MSNLLDDETCKPDDDASFLIPAAGRGERMGRGSKALLELGGEPLIVWLARKALRVASEVVIATAPAELATIAKLCPNCRCIVGGANRQASIEHLVSTATRPWLVILDVARPFASLQLCQAVLQKAKVKGVAGAFLPPDVPIARIQHGQIIDAFDRSDTAIFQAPQAFNRTILRDVLAQARENSWSMQSTMQLVLRAKVNVAMVSGERQNIKLTHPEDWTLAQLLVEHLS